MTIEDLVPLTNGLTVLACGHALVCDRTRITAVSRDAIDVAFLMAGTSFAPRLRLLRARVLSASRDELTTIVERVVRHAVGCH